MRTAEALRLAIDILSAPSRVHYVRTVALPAGVQDILLIAAGDEDIAHLAAAETGRTREVVQAAAIFFIEQVLLFSGSDSYRVLGATPLAPISELRRNMALLMRWLHPDLVPDDARAVFASRISRAWNNVKTPERRAAYDEETERLGGLTERSVRGPIRTRRKVTAHARIKLEHSLRVKYRYSALVQALTSRIFPKIKT